jgi:hypothetical protein
MFLSLKKTATTQSSDGRYVYETKRPLQLCWLATSGTQEGRIAHHHTDATVPHIVALLGSTFHAVKIQTLSYTSKYFGEKVSKSPTPLV